MTGGFEPAAWLAAFEAAGGSYAVTTDNRLWLGEIHVVGGLSDHTAPLLGHPERVEAIKALIREKCLIG